MIPDEANSGSVGIFWYVDGMLVAAGCSLGDAVCYGDCLTYDGGHAEHWERWRQAGARWITDQDLPSSILTNEYDEYPRGRIVKERAGFVLYADRRIQTTSHIAEICERFRIDVKITSVRGDTHYRRSETSI